MKRKIILGTVATVLALAAIGAVTNAGDKPATPAATAQPTATPRGTLIGSRMTDKVDERIRDYGLTESFTLEPGTYTVEGATEFCLDGNSNDKADAAWALAHGADEDSLCLPAGDRIRITEADATFAFYVVGPPSTLISIWEVTTH